jgi:hypothetical protein
MRNSYISFAHRQATCRPVAAGMHVQHRSLRVRQPKVVKCRVVRQPTCAQQQSDILMVLHFHGALRSLYLDAVHVAVQACAAGPPAVVTLLVEM